MPRMVRLRTAAARAISSLVSASAPGASRDAWRDWSWFESTMVGQASLPNRSSCFWLASAKPSAFQSLADQLEVEHEVARRAQLGRQRRIAREQLPDRHPLRERIDERPELGQEAGQLRPVLVVEMDLAIVRAPSAIAARVGEQLLVLEEGVEDIEPEAVDPALQPAADHRQHRLAHRRVSPVHVGLLGQERVHVELAADLVPGPRRTAEERGPVVRLLDAPEAVLDAIAPEIPIAVRAGRVAPRFLEPAMGRAGVVHHQVEHDPDAAAVRLGDQPIEVVEGAEQRIDGVVVGDVVADVEAGRRVDRREPDGIDAERPLRAVVDVVELVDQAGQVTDAIVVAVRERARVDLVDDATLPPVVTEGGTRDRRGDLGLGRGLGGAARSPGRLGGLGCLGTGLGARGGLGGAARSLGHDTDRPFVDSRSDVPRPVACQPTRSPAGRAGGASAVAWRSSLPTYTSRDGTVSCTAPCA